jgi:hypothetical protein
MDDKSSWFGGFDLNSIQNSIRQSVDEASHNKRDEKGGVSNIASQDDDDARDNEPRSLSFYEQDTDMLHIPKERLHELDDRKKPDSSLWSVDPSVGTPSSTPQKIRPTVSTPAPATPNMHRADEYTGAIDSSAQFFSDKEVCI